MSRLVRSALRLADHFVEGPSLRHRLKSLGNLLPGAHGSSKALAGNSFVRPFMNQSSSGLLSNTIHSSQSLPTRFALSRPFRAPNLPRVPVVARNVSQVGLGTARNFSSGRQVFQNLVENVPITTRALWEAEWDLKEKKASQKRQLRQRQTRERRSSKNAKLRLSENRPVVLAVSSPTVEDTAIDFSTFFRQERSDDVTTYLVVPLYPSEERLPLATADHSDMFQLSELRDIHSAHSFHSIRVSSIFARLDAADVWSRGVDCQCYGGPPTGLVTSLRLIFDGWTEEQVLGVIGEAGMGWCDILEECRSAPLTNVDKDAPFALVMPTLDFSSSFSSHRDAQMSAWEDAGSLEATRLSNAPWLGHPPVNDMYDGWSVHQTGRSLGFSEDFLSHCSASSPASSYCQL